jgi:ethanolamine ammonia-lyase small subunit
MSDSSITPDPWTGVRRHTPARVALGRAGGSLPTAEVLDFAAAHAAARDAVHAELDAAALAAELARTGLPVLLVDSAAADRLRYLQRPDLGRRLSDAGRATIAAAEAKVGRDVALVVGDGLSALAAERHAAAVVAALVPALRQRGFGVGPICVVRQARVAIEDEIGALLGARLAVILLGERPGLGAADSLGAYLVHDPRPGRTDAERNCVSNIRPAGLPIPVAVDTLVYLITESLRRRISGVGLKDERSTTTLPPS